MPNRPAPPDSLQQLQSRAQKLSGRSLGELASLAGMSLPERLNRHKGLIGQLLEWHLGADAGSQALPDFTALGVELKTLPLNAKGQPAESTFVSQINLLGTLGQSFEHSSVWAKLQQVLWLPIEADPALPLAERLVGTPLLWQPSLEQKQVLQQDWEELLEEISLGRVESIRAQQGQYLQIRPKGANRHSLTQAIGPSGSRIWTHPRAFYLRTGFTQAILQQNFS